MKFEPKPGVYLKDHFSFFAVDELAAAYTLFDAPDRARAQAEYEFSSPEGRVLVGDMFAAIVAASPAAAERIASLLDEPPEIVWGLRDDLLERLARIARRADGRDVRDDTGYLRDSRDA